MLDTMNPEKVSVGQFAKVAFLAHTLVGRHQYDWSAPGPSLVIGNEHHLGHTDAGVAVAPFPDASHHDQAAITQPVD
jgi:hypothetical protein